MILCCFFLGSVNGCHVGVYGNGLIIWPLYIGPRFDNFL